MLTRDVAKGIHRIEDAYTNWYLVEEGDRLTVVDCGVPASWSSLVRLLTGSHGEPWAKGADEAMRLVRKQGIS